MLRRDRLSYEAPFSYAELTAVFAGTHTPVIPFEEEAVVTFIPKAVL